MKEEDETEDDAIPQSQDPSFLRRLAGASAHKAGWELFEPEVQHQDRWDMNLASMPWYRRRLAPDQTEINRRIAEASKGSKFYEVRSRSPCSEGRGLTLRLPEWEAKRSGLDRTDKRTAGQARRILQAGGYRFAPCRLCTESVWSWFINRSGRSKGGPDGKNKACTQIPAFVKFDILLACRSRC